MSTKRNFLPFTIARRAVRVFRARTNPELPTSLRGGGARAVRSRSDENPNGSPSGAFTLVELLISIAIFTVITSVAVFNHAQFNASVLLTNLAYEIALSVRQAQFYGIVVKQTSADPTKFDSGYGVRFNTGTPTSYILFEDVKSGSSPNHIHDGSDVDIKTFSIARGNKISRICVDSNCTPTIVDLTFVRPNPDAYIRAGGVSGTPYSKAEICVSSPQKLKRKITVESTGQISVDADASGVCP